MADEIYKSSDGTLARVRDRVSFVGSSLYLVAELVYPTGEALVDVVRPGKFDEWGRGTVDDWVKAVELANARKKREEKRKRAVEEGERWGLEVRVRGRFVDYGTLYVVRSTKTQVTASDGSRWHRSTGKRIGDKAGRRIHWNDLETVNDYLGDRERVDIVAERRAAADGGGAS